VTMGKVRKPKPVKLIVGLISGKKVLFDKVKEKLMGKFGEVDEESILIPFVFTDYYREEMGEGLLRKFLSFKMLIDPGELADIKLWTNELEDAFRDEHGRRQINIDPGYINAAKLVLATTKDFSHRIYIGQGIYAEVTLCWRRGRFTAQEWTYPDYRSEEYMQFFKRVREAYMEQMRKIQEVERDG